MLESWNSFLSAPGFWFGALQALPLCHGHSTFYLSLSRPEEALVSISKQVSQEIHEGLKDIGLTALSSEKTASLIGQLRNIAKKENCVVASLVRVPMVVVVMGNSNVEKVDLTLEISYEAI